MMNIIIGHEDTMVMRYIYSRNTMIIFKESMNSINNNEEWIYKTFGPEVKLGYHKYVMIVKECCSAGGVQPQLARLARAPG